MSEKPNLFQILGKIVEDTIITPSKVLLEQQAGKTTVQKKKSLLPETRAAVFWDYENFSLPKDIHPDIFFHALFPPEQESKLMTKRIYGHLDIVKTKMKILENNGFEYIRTIETGKKNASDFMMANDCASFCGKADPPLVVLLITGDADFLPLVQLLTQQGHDVRMVVNDKGQVSQKVHRIVPRIIDRQEIIKSCRRVSSRLYSLSQLMSYLISKHPQNRITIKEFVDEVKDQLIEDRLDNMIGTLELLLRLEDYSKYFSSTGEIIKNIELPPAIPAASYSPKYFNYRKDTIMMKLGAEPDDGKWENYWQEFTELIPDRKEQEKIIKNIYSTSGIPATRSRLQGKLIERVLKSQEQKAQIKDLAGLLVEKTKFNCKKCKKTFTSKKALAQHAKDVHDKKTKKKWTCPECPKSFQSKASLDQHVKTVHAEQAVKRDHACPTCGKIFRTDQSLEQHVKDSHGVKEKKEKTIKCPYCNMKFTSKTGRDQHVKAKHP